MVSELISGPSQNFAASRRLIGHMGAQRDQKGPMTHITPGPIQPLGGPAWQHYRKPVANFLVMLQSSAMPTRIKRTVLTQEVIRALRNCRFELPWEEKAKLAVRMKASERFRHHVIEAGVIGFDKMVQVAAEGGRPVNRKSSWSYDPTDRRMSVKQRGFKDASVRLGLLGWR